MSGPNVMTDSAGRLISAGRITSLAPGEIFVFGSNAAGRHGHGAAKDALDHFGAVYGRGHGLQGQSYAIDTMSGLDVIADEVRTFLGFASEHPELTFLVTKVGTGISTHTSEDIAPYFAGAPANVALPQEFIDVLGGVPPVGVLEAEPHREAIGDQQATRGEVEPADDAPRDELIELLMSDATRRGDVYRLSYVEGLKPPEIAVRLNIETIGWVYAYRTQIDAILDGKIPTSRDRQRQAASAIRALLKTAGPDLSSGAQDLLKNHLRDLLAAQADPAAQDVGDEVEPDALDDEASLNGKSGMYAFSYGWYLERPLDPDGGNTLIKVGKAADIGQRLAAHKSGARAHIPEPLVVVRAYEVPAALVDVTESTFHNLLRTAGHHNPRRPDSTGSGVGREWFLTNQDFLDAIAKALGLTTLYIGSSAFVE